MDRNLVSYAFHITLLKATLYMAVPLGIINNNAIRACRNSVSLDDVFHIMLKATL